MCCGRTEDEFEQRAAAIGREPAELRENGVCGLSGEVADAVGRWRDEGVERMYLQVLDIDDTGHLELLAGEALAGLQRS